MKGLLAILLIYCFSLPMSRAKPIDVLIYSATAWFRHAEIPQLNGFLVRLGDKNNINVSVTEDPTDLKSEIPRLNGFLVRLGDKNNINVSVTEDPTDLKSENLKKYNLLLFNNSTNLGESIPREIQKEIINWFKSGGGIMAMHAGIVQNGTWPELIEIAGCDFDSDSDYMEARFLVDPKTAGDPLLAGKKKQFMYTADWLCFNRSVTGLSGVEVLLRLDEKSYTPIREHPSYVGKKPMGNDHPICWRRKLGKGRYLFTGLGHDIRSINTEFARKHIIAAIRWTANSAKSIEKSQSN